MRRPNCTVSIQADKTNIQKEDENRPRVMKQGLDGKSRRDGKIILL